MKISYIEFQGFRGFRDRTRVDIPTGFAVISGRNGVGKSTICDAIEFGLTGQLSKYHVDQTGRESTNDYLWWLGENEPEEQWVEVGIADDEKTYSIRRSRRDGIQNTPPGIEKLLVSQNALPENAIDNLIRTTILRDEWITTWSLDLKSEERFRFVQEALGVTGDRHLIDRADTILKKAAGLSSEANQNFEDSRDRIQAAITERADHQSKAASATHTEEIDEIFLKYQISAPENLAERLTLANQLLEDMKISSKMVSDALELSNANRELLNEFTNEILEERVDKETEIESDISAEHSDAIIALGEAEAEVASSRSVDHLADSLASIIEHGEMVGLQEGHCPLCDAARTQGEFASAISEARQRLSHLEQKKALADRLRAEAQNQIEVLEIARTETLERRAKLARELVKAREIDKSINDTFETYGVRASSVHTQNVEPFLQQTRERIIELELLTAKLNSSRAVERILVAEKKIETLRASSGSLERQKFRAQRSLDRSKELKKTLNSTINEMVDERLWALSPLLSDLYGRLRPHIEWQDIDYKIRGDVRRALNLTVGQDLNPQFMFSSGQRRALGLAFLIAVHLSRPWCNLQTLILDDPVQHIDDYRALNLVEILSNIAKQGRQVLVTIESNELADMICRKLQGSSENPGKHIKVDLSPNGGGTIANEEILETMPRRVLRESA